MKIRDFSPPNRAEIAGIPPDAKWIDEYMQPYVEHLKLLTQAIQGKLSSENLNEEVKVLQVRHLESVEVSVPRVKGRPTGATLIAFSHPCTLTEVQPLDASLLRVAVSFADAVMDDRSVTILVKGA